MTEEEWMNSTDPKPMLEFLRGKASDRKLRLFAVVCCRRIAHVISSEDIRKIIYVSENYADGVNGFLAYECNRAELYVNWENRSIPVIEAIALDAFRCLGEAINVYDASVNSGFVMGHLELSRQNLTEEEERRPINPQGATSKNLWIQKGRKHELMEQSGLVREIIANPFRPVTFSRAWRTSTVTSLAQTIYDDRHMPSGLFDNQRMGILADALEDAGCDNKDILEHCRQGGEHVRGCWVVDLVLAKE